MAVVEFTLEDPAVLMHAIVCIWPPDDRQRVAVLNFNDTVELREHLTSLHASHLRNSTVEIAIACIEAQIAHSMQGSQESMHASLTMLSADLTFVSSGLICFFRGLLTTSYVLVTTTQACLFPEAIHHVTIKDNYSRISSVTQQPENGVSPDMSGKPSRLSHVVKRQGIVEH